MEQDIKLSIINSNPSSPSPKPSETPTCWDSFLKDSQLTTFAVKEDQSLEFNLFEESPIFNENPTGNLRKIQSRIKTILSTSSFPQDMIKTAKKAYKSNPQYMHLAIDRTDFRDMKIFDVLNEEFESIKDLEDQGMLNKVEDEEFNWWMFGTCKEINFINAHEKELEEDDDQKCSHKKKRGRKKKEAGSAKIKKKKQEKNMKEKAGPTYWERCSVRRRGSGYMNEEDNKGKDEENNGNNESFGEGVDFVILLEVDGKGGLEGKKLEDSVKEEEEEEAVVLIELEETEFGEEEQEDEVVVLIELEEEEAEERPEEHYLYSEPRKSPRKKAKRMGKENILNGEMGYGLVNGKRRRVSSSEKRKIKREFDLLKLRGGTKRLTLLKKHKRR